MPFLISAMYCIVLCGRDPLTLPEVEVMVDALYVLFDCFNILSYLSVILFTIKHPFSSFLYLYKVQSCMCVCFHSSRVVVVFYMLA